MKIQLSIHENARKYRPSVSEHVKHSLLQKGTNPLLQCAAISRRHGNTLCSVKMLEKEKME